MDAARREMKKFTWRRMDEMMRAMDGEVRMRRVNYY